MVSNNDGVGSDLLVLGQVLVEQVLYVMQGLVRCGVYIHVLGVRQFGCGGYIVGVSGVVRLLDCHLHYTATAWVVL